MAGQFCLCYEIPFPPTEPRVGKGTLGHSLLSIREPGAGTLRVHPKSPQLRVCYLHSSSPWSQCHSQSI